MQRPQLALLRLQSRPEDVNFGVNNARYRLCARSGHLWFSKGTAPMHYLKGLAAG